MSQNTSTARPQKFFSRFKKPLIKTPNFVEPQLDSFKWLVEKGLKEITNIIFDTVKENVYVSFDMDCLDPAYAPGISVPVPIGLESQDTTHMIKKITNRGIIGFDIMEVCPKYDLNNQTSHLASRMIGEVVSSCKV